MLTAVLGVVGLLIVLTGIGAAVGPAGDGKKPVAAGTSTSSDSGQAGLGTPGPSFDPSDPDGDGIQETTPPPPPVAADYTPTVKDFSILLKIKSKECFGSAGCNVTYEPRLTIVGPNVDQGGSYEITYEVRGGDDGAAIDTIELDAGEYSVSEGLASTPRQSSKLTAVITEVEVG